MNKQRIRFLLTALIAVLLAVIVAAFLLPSFYALPTIDDFANTNNVLAKRAEGLSVIETTAFLTIQALVELGGSPLVFMHILFAPFGYFGIVGLRITVLLMNALFLLSIFSLVRSLVTCVIGDRNVLHLLVAYAIAVVSVVGYRYQTEVFSWMTCSLGYVFPLSVMLLGVSAYIRGICSKKKRCVIVGVLLGILGAWSTVQIAALTCGLYLLAYLMLMGRGGFPRARIVPLIIIAVLALSCLFAPGLYIRKSEFPATSLGQNILDSIRSLGGSIKRLAGSPFCISAILVMLLGIRWIRPSKPLRPVKLLWTAGFSLLAPIIVAFPVRYSGYIGLPNRG